MQMQTTRHDDRTQTRFECVLCSNGRVDLAPVQVKRQLELIEGAINQNVSFKVKIDVGGGINQNVSFN